MIRAGEQWNLWDFVGMSRAKATEKANLLGPYRLTDDDNVIPRHLDCNNYDSCLAFAAKHRWDSFSCEGCRRTQKGRFVFEDSRRKKR